jgi:hypothetical protein
MARHRGQGALRRQARSSIREAYGQACLPPSCALALLLCLLLAVPAAGQEWSPRDYEGPRYVLTTDVDPASAQDHLRLLEAHYDVLAKLLVRKPDHEGRLVVRLFASPEDYRRIVRSDAGGIYTFHDRIANVSKQARRYWTRHLLLHEATHQYVLLAFAGNRDLLPWWLDEGLAEWGAFHVWDGETLRCPDPDVISIQDYPETARSILSREGWTVEQTLSGSYENHRAEAWLLVHHLMSDPGRRRRLLKILETLPRKLHVEDEAKSIRTTRDLLRRYVTRKLDRLTAELRRDADDVRLTWNVVTIAWDRRGDTIVGRTATTGVLAHHRPIDRATATISFRYRVLGGRKGWVGLAHRIRSKDAFRVVTLTSPGSVLWNELGNRRWTRHGAVGSAGAAYRDTWHAVTIRFTEKEIRVTVDGKELPPLRRKAAEPLGRVGLFIDACEAEFVGFVVR